MSSTTLPVCPKTGSTSPSLTVHLCLHTAPGNRECARLYCDAQALLNDIRASYDTEARTGAKEIIRRATTTDLLVLDDLGAEQLTDWGKDTIHRIVNSRYCEDRATICTTSLPTNPHDHQSLLFEIGGRALSILHQMCHSL